MDPRGTNKPERGQSLLATGGKVLLVDEDPGDLHYYRNILEGYGCWVRACRSYQEGVRCLGEEPFNFVIVTQGSPKFEGRCVLERAVESDRRLPVLVVARCLDMKCYLESMQMGAVDYRVEPLTVQELCWFLKTRVA
ncbi:MAG TPA: response regulator [Terriglobia bacterium]|jgi:DNA-binding NtrC family response regulator|nr:response regulator [Terriglobia bacterium]